MHAYGKDILRTIRKEKKRIAALMTITALGVTMMCGLRAACDDLRVSADTFFDQQNLHDIEIMSTLGLTDGDVAALEELDGVAEVRGVYSEDVRVLTDDGSRSAEVRTFEPDGIDCPYVTDGRLPEAADEIAVTKKYLKESGKEIGDTLEIREEDSEDSESVAIDISEDSTDDTDEEDAASDGSEENDAEDDPTFESTVFTITGVVTDITNVDNAEGSMSFRDTSTVDYTFFMLSSAVNSDIYTSVVLTADGAPELNTFGEEYEDKIAALTDTIRTYVAGVREQARYDEVVSDAQTELDDARNEAEEAFEDAEAELSDAADKLSSGRSELEDGQAELDEQSASGRQQIADAKNQIAENEAALADGTSQLDAAEKQLADGEAEIAANKETLAASRKQLEDAQAQLDAGQAELDAQKASAEQQLEEGQATLTSSLEQAQTSKAAVDASVSALKSGLGTNFPEAEWDALEQAASASYQATLASGGTSLDVTGLTSEMTALRSAFGLIPADAAVVLCLAQGQADGSIAYMNAQQAVLTEQKAAAEAQFAAAQAEIDANQAQITAGLKQVEDGEAQIAAAEQELAAGKSQIAEKRQQIADGQAQIASGKEELASKEAEMNSALADAQQEIDDGWAELEDGEQEYADGLAEYQSQKADTEKKLADAQQEIDDIDMPVWYVQDRTALGGYSDIVSDADCIEVIGTAFPVMFLIVAILISLTTIARMVEEDRGLIGTYQALGFSVAGIRRKYLVYAGTAVLLGGLLGNLLGFVVLPEIIFVIFRTMYLVPSYFLGYLPAYGLGGIILFGVGILGSTWLTCRSVLREMPASLMRPRPPMSGSRIILERWTWLWSKFSFLNKITARNLFRYKKRFLMTVFGIAGCTGLLVCGFAIKDTVADLMPRQYEHINRYDLLAVTNGGDDNISLTELLDGSSDCGQYLNLEVSSVHLKNADGDSLTIPMYVVPDDADLSPYFSLETSDGETIEVAGNGIFVTDNAGNVLDFETGDTVSLQDLQLREASAEVRALIVNYLGNGIYVTQSCYEEMFGEYEPNAALILVDSSDSSDSEAALKSDLEALDGIVSITSTQELKDSFSSAFQLMNLVVYIVIILAGALAFVVLFTLATTNISERERELATIKVLGFYDQEVHRYVNKETLILTGIGIVFGLPLGALLGHMLMVMLKLPSVNFAVSIHPVSFVIASVMTFAFALCVDRMTNQVLNRIDPAEALKSVE